MLFSLHFSSFLLKPLLVGGQYVTEWVAFVANKAMIGFKDTKLKFVRKRSRNGNLIQDVATPTSPGTNLNPTQISSLDDDNDEATKFM